MESLLIAAAAAAPWIAPEGLTGGGPVLLLAPHPDDETLGCGAAIAALTAAGRWVQVVCVTDGAASHPRSRTHPPATLARLRRDEVTRAVAILTGGRGPDPVWMGYPDLAAPDDEAGRAEAVARLRPLLPPGPGAIWATWEGDPHPDHGRVARIAALLHAARPDLARWSYPIWGRFADAPAPPGLRRLDAPGHGATKAAALAAHASQMTGLIADDPDGFVMPPREQAHFLDHPELFIPEGPPHGR